MKIEMAEDTSTTPIITPEEIEDILTLENIKRRKEGTTSFKMITWYDELHRPNKKEKYQGIHVMDLG